MTEMIERVARKIHLAGGLAHIPWGNLGTTQTVLQQMARAAIEETVIELQEYGEPQAASVLSALALRD